ncbi:MAG TPA: bifunctional precorrin-2 dehydrogenase/sirohydrochlorin ferrochelatase [Chloroflexota bacterium]|nr:bifunctional precorrin-2 dehydrogenase/sirohydrochlorin ferrochelatase [Chloroflexota bacterium]
MSYYPVYLDLRGQRCVVVGDGPMAVQKVRGLLNAEAHVVAIAAEPCPELQDLPLELIRRAYAPGDLAGARLAIDASGDRAVMTAMRREADACGVLLNVVDYADACDFIAPAIVRRGSLQLAVSTSGESPFLAAALRSRLESELGPEWAAFVKLVGRIRRDLRRRGVPAADQAAIYQTLLESCVLDLLREGAVAAAEREADRIVRQAAPVR